MKISNKLKKIRDKYTKLRGKAWEDYRNICREEDEEILKLINFKYKYIKYDDDLDVPKYLYVNEQFRHKNLSGDPVLILRGQGFNGNITKYTDETYMTWDQFFEIKILIENLDRDLKNIKEIAKEEYNNKFLKMLESIKEEHIHYLEIYDGENITEQ